MKPIIIFLFCSILSSIFGQEEGVWIHPNKGQWQDPILYKIELNCGEMYLEKDGFTYALNDFKSQMSHNHADNKENKSVKIETKIIQSQIIRSKFIGSSWKGEKIEKEVSSHYRNYFQGKDQSKWVSNVKSYHSVQLNNFYSKIDLLVEGKESNLKYSFIVQPNTDISQIQYEIKGANSVNIDKAGNLHITNRFGEIIEERPNAWNIIDGKKRFIKVNFHLKNNIISFQFPDGFDKNHTLTIDPGLTFSTFSGSTSDNWGMTATPDNQGNLCSGGIVFNDGGLYPVTTGSFDTEINGGNSYALGAYIIPGFDIAISKFNQSGSTLLYATFIGGVSNEAPHSLVSGANGELYIMGVTSSPDFPITSGAFDETFNGGPQILENELYYNGADIFVSKLSSDGKTMLGSTYIGGTGTDGVNISDLNYNYGDPFRGEIIEGENGYVFISSTSQSIDFPTKNASQNSLNGLQDAVVFKLNSDLSAMAWSTYFGGSGEETGNSLQQSSNGELYVTGGTNSSNLPFLIGNDLSYNGGIDGYLTRLNQQIGSIIGGTYMGLNEYDQAYFVQLDLNNDVYVFGQTESDWPITAGHYGTPNSGQFIRKYTQDLTTISWTTMIGAGTGNPEISPTAFLVSNCFEIYLSGWGGKINVQNSKHAVFSTTLGLNTTNDAFQNTTNGDNFYIAVLGHDANSLKYGTFMGGINGSYNHVDGGTSRFDKSGTIYHAVCGACGGNPNGFTTTPGVFSPQNKSTNCNLAAFKFELNNYIPIIGSADSIICMPAPITFRNSVSNGNSFLWDFGDGTLSRTLNPSHIYTTPGSYIIKLIITDTVNCFTKDSVFFHVRVNNFIPSVITPPPSICAKSPYQLSASGGTNYSWTPTNILNNPLIPSPIATIDSITNFTVNISNECGSETFNLTLNIFKSETTISKDTSICIGGSASLSATGGSIYKWNPALYLNNSIISNPISTAEQNTTYSVEVTTADGCLLIDSTKVTVFYTPPIPILSDSLIMCLKNPLVITAGGAEKYTWSPNNKINTLVGDNVEVNPTNDAYYYCEFKNACGISIDSVFIDVVKLNIETGKDTTICPSDSAYLSVNGGTKYRWYLNSTYIDSTQSKIIVHPQIASEYTVIGSDKNGCIDTAIMKVNLFQPASFQVCPTIYAIIGDQVKLSIISNSIGNYVWSPYEYLTCTNCSNPIANPDKNFTYTVIYTDTNGCKATDKVKIIYNGLIYVPNSFTPDGNENRIFRAEGGNIKTFEISIFNRWGELIFSSNSFNEGWDGTYKGVKCQVGTYIWKILYSDYYSPKKELVGHVNLLR